MFYEQVFFNLVFFVRVANFFYLLNASLSRNLKCREGMRKGSDFEIDGRSSERGAGSQVDGPSDDKVTEGWSRTVERNTNFPPDEWCREVSTSLFTPPGYPPSHTHTSSLPRGIDIRVSRLSKIGIRATNLFGFPPRRWERCKVNRYRRDDKKKRKNRGKKNHRGFRSSDEPLALIKASEINREQTGICFFFYFKMYLF